MPTILESSTNIISAKAKAITIARGIQTTHQALLTALSEAVSMVWDDEDPASIVTELGVHAAAIFSSSSAATICLETVSPGCTDAILAKVGTYTVNQDGSITNVVKPTP